jgi:phosphoenolpyruvate-protein kinase (PTS system EI component)
MPPQMIPEIKYIIRSVNLKDAQEMVYSAMKLSTVKEVEEFSDAKLREILK